jgi:16S rRNA processing protein RimM
VQGKGLVAQLRGCTDRDMALRFARADIAVERSALPQLEQDEYYWHQLEGLRVYAKSGDGSRVLLGRVDHLVETGANDVLVVKPDTGSLDQRERLIPWVPDDVVLKVDLAQGEMLVDWDPEF